MNISAWFPTFSKFFKKAQHPNVAPAQAAPASPGPYSIVFDVSNQSLIAITTSIPTANILAETMLDTAFFHNIRSEELGKIKNSPPTQYPEWAWDQYKRIVKKTHPDLVTPDMRERAELTVKKAAAIQFAMNAMQGIRNKIRTGFIFQEHIYTQKESQARAFKASGFSESMIPNIPYVIQDAEVRNLSLTEATEDIILHATLLEEYLLRSEKVRLALLRAIKKARSESDINEALETFRREGIL